MYQASENQSVYHKLLEEKMSLKHQFLELEMKIMVLNSSISVYYAIKDAAWKVDYDSWV